MLTTRSHHSSLLQFCVSFTCLSLFLSLFLFTYVWPSTFSHSLSLSDAPKLTNYIIYYYVQILPLLNTFFTPTHPHTLTNALTYSSLCWTHKETLNISGADVSKNYFVRVVTPCWIKPIWLDVASHVTILNQYWSLSITHLGCPKIYFWNWALLLILCFLSEDSVILVSFSQT